MVTSVPSSSPRVARSIAILACLSVGGDVGCDDDRGIEGELASMRAFNDALAVEATTLYRAYGSQVYSFDVTDPHTPIDADTRADGFVACGGGCSAYAFRPSHAFLLSSKQLSLVALPNAGIPAYVFDLPDPTMMSYAQDMVSLSNGGLAITRFGDDNAFGDLLLIDPYTTTVTTTLFDNGFEFGAASAVNSLVVAPAATAGTTVFVIVDASDLYAPIERPRVPITLPDDYNFSVFSVRGRDLIVRGERPENDRRWIGWYRFSADYASLELLHAKTDRAYSHGCRPAFWNDFVFVGTYDDGEFGTIVLRLDTAAGIVEERLLPAHGYVGDIVVDDERGLLFVGGEQHIQIFDLGVVTGGEPRWP